VNARCGGARCSLGGGAVAVVLHITVVVLHIQIDVVTDDG